MTQYIDRTGEPDDVFEREVLARVESFDATAALRRVEAELLHLEQLARDYNGTILNPSTAFRSSAALIRAAIEDDGR